jgi:hypothetical protein
MSEKKRLAKDEEENEVQKRRHEEAKQEKMNEVPKHTAVQKHGVFSLLTVQT